MEDQTVNPYREAQAAPRTPRAKPAAAEEARAVRPFRDVMVSIVLVLMVLVTYWGVWNFDFIYFDDPGYISDNLNVTRGLPLFNRPSEILKTKKLLKDPAGFRDSVYWAFTAFEQSNWHPLTWLSHMLDVELYGLKESKDRQPGDGLGSGGHHVTNIILHSCNVLLLFWLLRVMTGRTWCSAVVAALFAVHPMHVESVAWVAERKDVLSVFFGLLTLIVYVIYARRTNFKPDMMALIVALSVFMAVVVLLCFEAFNSLNPVTREPNATYLPIHILWVFPVIFAIAGAFSATTGRWNLILYCAVFFLYAVGLLAKPMLITLPCICLLLDFWPLHRMRFKVAKTAPGQRPAIDRSPGARRRAKRNQRLPPARRRGPADSAGGESVIQQLALLVAEKAPLFMLAAISAIITPYAQNHGGSMASQNDLPLTFRLENSTQSYLRYITRMFYPGRMTTLYLLDMEHVNHLYTAAAVLVLLIVTGLVVWSLFHRRRYLAFGWFWYLGTLVPVIGLVQVGEQTHADRYTYIPYIGLFIMIAWGAADLIHMATRAAKRAAESKAKTGAEKANGAFLRDRPEAYIGESEIAPWFGRRTLQFVASVVTISVLLVCITWSKYQLQFWTNAEVQLRHALTIDPDSWNMLNNLGVYLWKEGQDDDKRAAQAEAKGDMPAAADYRKKSKAFKDDAMAQWLHGIAARPTATDIHSNLGYSYSESASQTQALAAQAQAAAEKTKDPEERKRLMAEAEHQTAESNRYMNLAESHLLEAVKLKDISPRPHNNLGRVFLRRYEPLDRAASEMEEKAKKDPALAGQAKELRDKAQAMLDLSIAHFERAVLLDPSLLEARLNLGQVFISKAIAERTKRHDEKAAEKDFKKAEEQYYAILKLHSESVKDREQISNFSQACNMLANIATLRGKEDEAIGHLQDAVALSPDNLGVLLNLISHLYQKGDYRDGDRYFWKWFAQLPAGARSAAGENMGNQLDRDGKKEQALHVWEIVAWIMATSPDPSLRNPPEAGKIGQFVATKVTQERDPVALDVFAAALAANGQFDGAVQAAQKAIALANAQNNKPLAAAIAARLQLYEHRTPYASNPDGSDRQ